MKQGDQPELHVQFGNTKVLAKGLAAITAVRPLLFVIAIFALIVAPVMIVTASVYGVPKLIRLAGY